MNFSVRERYILWKNNYLNVTRVSEADFLTSTWMPPKRLGSLSSVERISSKEKGAEPPLLPLIFAKICKIKIELIKRSFIFLHLEYHRSHCWYIEPRNREKIWDLKIFLGYDINYLSIWPFMGHPWFPTRKASKLTFACFQLAGWWPCDCFQLAGRCHSPASWKQTNISFEAFLVGNQGWRIKGQMLR